MSEEQFNELVKLFGEVAIQAYQAALHKVYADIVAHIISFIILTILFVITIVVVLKLHNYFMTKPIDNNYGETDESFSLYFTWSLGVIISFVMGLFAIINLVDFISKLMATDWYVLQNLASLVIK